MADEQQTLEGNMLKWQEMQRKKKAAEMPGEAPTLTDRVATSTSTTKAPSLNYEKPINVGTLDPYAAPDTSSLRAEYAADKAERRKDYEDQRNTNAWSELAQKIGNGLARYGAAQEGARKGISIGKIDTGTDTDYSDRTKLAYKDYVDELADLQTLRKDQEKELLTNSVAEYQSRLDALKMRAAEAKGILDRNLERDGFKQKDNANTADSARKNEIAAAEAASRTNIEQGKLEAKVRADTLRSLAAESAQNQDLIERIDSKTLDHGAVASSLGMKYGPGFWDIVLGRNTAETKPPSKEEVVKVLGEKKLEISNRIRQITDGEIPSRAPAHSQSPPSLSPLKPGYVRVKDPRTDRLETIPQSALAEALRDGATEVK